MSMKNSNDIGNRTRDLPACNAVRQPTAPPLTPACHAHAPYCQMRPARLYDIFSHIVLQKPRFSGKKVIGNKKCSIFFNIYHKNIRIKCVFGFSLIRTNRELEELNKGENIVKWIKGQRISWLGHLERMEEDRMPKKIFTQELEETRRRGRPRKGRRVEVERDLQVLGVRRWRELVIDREKWRGIVRQAKAHSGL